MSSTPNENSAGTCTTKPASSSSSLEEDMTKASITSASVPNSTTATDTTATATATDTATATATATDTAIDEETKGDTNDGDNHSSSGSSESDTDDDKRSNEDTSTSEDEDKKENDKDPVILLSKALTFKEEGNNLFKAQKYTQASRTYKKGINLIKHLHNGQINSPSNDEQITSLLLSLQSNLCMVYYKLANYKQCHAIADYIITKIDSQNSKAFYRRGLSNYKLKKISSAKQDLHKAYTYNPKDKAIIKEYRMIKKEYESVVQKSKKDKEKQKQALAKAFEGGKGGDGSSAFTGSFLYNDKEEELKRKQEKQKQKEEEEKKLKEKRKIDWENDCVERMSKNEEVLSFEEYEKQLKKQQEEEDKARKKARKEKEEKEREERRKQLSEKSTSSSGYDNNNDSSDDDDDILTEKELQSLRGYKKTSDGRTTSYFTREQTEEEKKLLGSIAPKKLGASTTTNTGAHTATMANATTGPQRLDSSVSMTSSSSAWNQAGTWEEKNTSEWCNQSLEKFLKLATGRASTDDIAYEALVIKVKDLKGDASVAFVSGKKRYVFDYSTDLSFEITASEKNDLDMDVDDVVVDDKIGKKSVVAKGSLSLPDISSTSISDEEIEVQIMSWKNEPKDEYKDGVMKCREDLIHHVREQVFAFVSAFNSQY